MFPSVGCQIMSGWMLMAHYDHYQLQAQNMELRAERERMDPGYLDSQGTRLVSTGMLPVIRRSETEVMWVKQQETSHD